MKVLLMMFALMAYVHAISFTDLIKSEFQTFKVSLSPKFPISVRPFLWAFARFQVEMVLCSIAFKFENQTIDKYT